MNKTRLIKFVLIAVGILLFSIIVGVYSISFKPEESELETGINLDSQVDTTERGNARVASYFDDSGNTWVLSSTHSNPENEMKGVIFRQSTNFRGKNEDPESIKTSIDFQLHFQSPSDVFSGSDEFFWVGFNEEPDEEDAARFRHTVSSVKLNLSSGSEEGYIVRMTGEKQSLDWYKKLLEKDHAMLIFENQHKRYEIDAMENGFIQLAEQFHRYIKENHSE